MRTRWLLIGAFTLTFAAGITAGLVAELPAPDRHGSRSHLARELDLTPAQREQMREIWGEVLREQRQTQGQRRRELAQEREAAIQQLLSEAQRAEYEWIQQRFAQGMAELHRARREGFEAAQQKTRAILTPQQQERFDKLVTQRRNLYERGGEGWRGRRRTAPEPSLKGNQADVSEEKVSAP